MRLLLFMISVIFIANITSCVKFPKREPQGEDPIPGQEPGVPVLLYQYPYANEAKNITAEITITTDGSQPLNEPLEVEIPHLKYNKSWLFLLTQDDCKHSAFSTTWAVINGKPYSDKYYYDIRHLLAGDLPPDQKILRKTLGSTDGTGNEVRFGFTTTLVPEKQSMSAKTVVRPGYTGDYYRFYSKSSLTWENVREMLNYNVGISFHDLNTTEISNPDSLFAHMVLAQKIIIDSLGGRGCKMLAEPNGNKAYIEAAKRYPGIKTMTAQAGTKVLYPFKVNEDLRKVLINRVFYDYFSQVESAVKYLMTIEKEERAAMSLGVHATNKEWVQVLDWLNDTYGKDGDDSVWATSLEEYFEYNYYRINSTLTSRISGNKLIITLSMPSEEYFYFPSVTLNVKGIDMSRIISVESGDNVKGMSYSNYKDGLMINVDCRKFLADKATFYVERYEKSNSESDKADALYFVNILKESAAKSQLLGRIIK